MARYSKADKKKLEANPYTYKVTDNKLCFTAEFRRDFWNQYQAGYGPREVLKELGYDLNLFTQKQIDGIVQTTRRMAEAGEFRDASFPRARPGSKRLAQKVQLEPTAENMTRLWTELQYVRQEVEALKRCRPVDKT